MSGGLVETYRSDDNSILVESVDGINWHDAPKPPRLHRCRVQTHAWTNYFSQVSRCACGAISLDGKHWQERNSR